MKDSLRYLVLAAAFFAVALGASAQEQGSVADGPDFGRAGREVVARQLAQKGDFADLVAQVMAREPATAQEALFALDVLMRAGMDREAAGAVRALKGRCPELSEEQIGAIYYAACDEFEAWGAAQALVEAYAGTLTNLTLDNRLLESMLQRGWSAEKVDRWLAGLLPAPTRKAPVRSDRWYYGRRVTPAEFLFQVRLRFDLDHGLGQPRLQELAAGARSRPDEVWRTMELLQALQYARQREPVEMDLAWLPGAVKPERATEARDLADALSALEQWPLALGFAQKAAATPLADEEVRWMGEMMSALWQEERLRAAFAAEAQDLVSKVLIRLDRKAESEQWLVKADDLRKKHGLGRNALFAGQVQAETGQYVIGGRIQKAEEKSKDDPDYWIERANYYHGRKEPALEEEALQKALELVKPEPKPGNTVHWSDRRSWVVGHFVGFLIRQQRRAEAIQWLRGEVERAPDAASAERAVHSLAYDFEKEIEAEDPVLWGWLAKRPSWGYTEERLVWRLLENAPPDRREACLARAEALAAGADPSRAMRLGWVMTRLNGAFSARAVPQLRYALQHAGEDDDLARTATLTLYEAFVQSGRWKEAEELFPKVAERLGPGEVEEWYARAAVSAAKAGAKADAMRLWAAVSNLSPSGLGYSMGEMARAGLREELVAFYRSMQKKLPTSRVPTLALKELSEGR